MVINKGIHARLAQSVERWTLNPTVVGSSPTLGGYFYLSVRKSNKLQTLLDYKSWEKILLELESKLVPKVSKV